jgi:Acetyltransferase (GNAT) domain
MPFPAAVPADLAADRWQLRALTDEDWRLEWTMSRDPEVVRRTLYPPDLTEESARERVRRTRQRADEQVATRYAVLDHNGVAVGTAGIACNETDPTKPRCSTHCCRTDGIAVQPPPQLAH